MKGKQRKTTKTKNTSKHASKIHGNIPLGFQLGSQGGQDLWVSNWKGTTTENKQQTTKNLQKCLKSPEKLTF